MKTMLYIDWETVLVHNFDFGYALEIIARTIVMFALVLVFLRLTGKKGVRQLTIFEVAIIIALGSAAGDPMFVREVAIVPSLVVFAVILGFYRLLTYFASKSEKFETVLEGSPMYIIEDGVFVIGEDHTYAKDEFFAEMRAVSVAHVGQVKTAILETNGTVSFFFFPDDEVKPGLPVLPNEYNRKSKAIPRKGDYACTYCAQVIETDRAQACPRCRHDCWVEAVRSIRIK